MRFEVGQRCYERDRGGDSLPRGGIIVSVLERSDQVVVAARWAGPPKRGKVTQAPFVDVHFLNFEDVNPDTIAPTASAERTRLARALLATAGARSSGSWGEPDQLALDQALALLDLPGRYAAGMDAALARARPVVDAASGELLRSGTGPLATVGVRDFGVVKAGPPVALTEEMIGAPMSIPGVGLVTIERTDPEARP